MLLVWRGLSASPPEPLPARTTAEQLLQLPPEEALRGYPVRIRGTVTFYDPEWSLLFVHDPTGGVFVSLEGKTFPIQAGQEVEVEGLSNASDVMPVIIRPSVKVLGPGAFPSASRPSLQALVTGAMDCQWITISGVVRKTNRDLNHFMVEINDSRRRWNVFILGNPFPRHKLEDLLDATVEFTGVGAVALDDLRRVKEFKLFVPDDRRCSLQASPVAISLATPAESIAGLKGLDHKKLPHHRVRIQGVVTLAEAGPFFVIQDASAGLRVLRPEKAVVAMGDLMEVTGYYCPGAHAPYLEDVTLRNLGAAPLPHAVEIKADKVVWGKFESQMVQLEGSLLDQLSDSSGPVLIVQSGQITFSVNVAGSPTNSPAHLPPNGSRVRITGVCWKQVDQPGKFQTFNLLVARPEQVETLNYPRYISRERVLQAVGVGALGLAAMLIWTALLRRRVRQQTEIIRLRLERENALEKRCHELIQNAEEIIFTLDKELRFTSINIAGETALGYAAAELLGRKLEQMLPAEQVAAIGEWVAKLAADPNPPSRELTLVSRSGKIVICDLSLRAAQTANAPGSVQGIARDITERKRLETERERLIQELQAALENVKTLSGLLPICSHCKKIRDDKGYWNRIESYISAHSSARFTHGMCPDCTRKHFPSVYDELHRNGMM